MIKGDLIKTEQRRTRSFLVPLGSDGYKCELADDHPDSRLSIDIWGHKTSAEDVRESGETIVSLVNWYRNLPAWGQWIVDKLSGKGSKKPTKKRT